MTCLCCHCFIAAHSNLVWINTKRLGFSLRKKLAGVANGSSRRKIVTKSEAGMLFFF